jgi:dihydrofolate reductase
MRKLVVSQFVSLDGVIENPMWTFPYWNDEIADFKHAELFGSNMLLLGRVTYDAFAGSWPGREDEQGYADHINTMSKAVVSTTRDDFAWGPTTVIRDNIGEGVNALKQQPGKDIVVFGSGKLVQALMDLDVVDQYNILIYPIVVGQGQKFFEDGRSAKLKVLQTMPFSSGVTGLVYVPDRSTSE